MTDQAGAHTPEKPRAASPCPFHGTLCEYVPMAHSAPAMAEELARLRAQKAQLVEALKKIDDLALGRRDKGWNDYGDGYAAGLIESSTIAHASILAAEGK